MQTLSFSARAGLLWPFGGPSLFPDRFHLGGPVSVRMFRANGMGPRDGSTTLFFLSSFSQSLTYSFAADSLGGDMYWSTGLSIISDVPRRPHWPVKLHGFLNVGRLDALGKGQCIWCIVLFPCSNALTLPPPNS